jgi:hypothetical protein
MKPFFRTAFVLAVFFFSAFTLNAERMPDRPGSTDHYFSDNRKYEITITCGEHFHSWSLKEDGRELWNNPLMTEPGEAAVSDNGETITLPLWGWRDEGGSSGIAVFNKKGALAREIPFAAGLPLEQGLRWVHSREISPDGRYIAIGENGKKQAKVTLFDAGTGNIAWEKNTGLPDVVEIRVSDKGSWTLVATRNDNVSDMAFILLDREGKEVWQKKIAGNFSYDVRNFLRFNSGMEGFAIYHLKPGRYISAMIPKTGT